MSNGSYFLSFVAGAGIGAAITWVFCKDFYKRRSEEEIEAMKEVYERRKKERDTAEEAINKPAVNDYVSKIRELNYSKESEKDEKPFIIPPENYGEFSDYEVVSLTYFADGVIADDNNEIVENAEDMVGFGFETHFGEYEEDTVYVRNDKYFCDYEIQRDLRTFDEAMTDNPPLKWEDE